MASFLVKTNPPQSTGWNSIQIFVSTIKPLNAHHKHELVSNSSILESPSLNMHALVHSCMHSCMHSCTHARPNKLTFERKVSLRFISCSICAAMSNERIALSSCSVNWVMLIPPTPVVSNPSSLSCTSWGTKESRPMTLDMFLAIPLTSPETSGTSYKRK